MTTFNLGEINVVWQFRPELVIRTGLIVLWTRTVWFSSVNGGLKPTMTETLHGINAADVKRYSYYFNSPVYNPKTPTSIIKSNRLWLMFITFVLEIVTNYVVFGYSVGGSYFNGMRAYSPMVILMKLLTLAFMWASVIYLDEHEQGVFASTIMRIGTVLLFMLLLVSANNFIALYVALEGMSLLLFVLTAQTKTVIAVESGLKYFFQSSFASVFLLLGIAFIYAGNLSFNFDEIQLALSEYQVDVVSMIGVFIVTTALLFKVSSFPGHHWVPDVYRGPTNSVLTVFAVVVKLAAFFVLLRVFSSLLVVVYVQFSWRLYVASALSMRIGALGAVRVINESGSRRQFVAYTSINQVGFVRLGLVCITLEGFWSSFIYLIVYLLASLVFLGTISRVRIYGSDKIERKLLKLNELRMLFNGNNKMSRRTDLFVLALSIWSMAGLPPLAGFFGKLGLWAALLRKMGDSVSGKSWVETMYAFPYVDATNEFDPFNALVLILLISVIVTIISGVYYFKLYELMSPSASNAEIVSTSYKEQSVYRVHDKDSMRLTVVLIVLMFSWCVMVCWTGWSGPWTFPATLFDSTWNSWSTTFDGYVI